MNRELHTNFLEITKTLHAFNSLSIYRNLLHTDILSDLRTLLYTLNCKEARPEHFANCYYKFFHSFVSNSNLPLREYIIDGILADENPFSKGAEEELKEGMFPLIESAARKDLAHLQTISLLSSAYVKSIAIQCFSPIENIDAMMEELPSWDFKTEEPNLQFDENEGIRKILSESTYWPDTLATLKEFHKNYGTGIFCKHKAFIWESDKTSGFFRGIDTPDPIRLADFIGYEEERQVVIENTLQFLKGYKANNVLLYGNRGTGKSSTVKALLNEYWTQGLRIIEVPKSYLVDFPGITRLVRDRKQKFIIFVDDLAFEDNEENYTALKAVLEGGIESKPDNVLIYATSNRRHLVKEKFSDRSGLQYGTADDEVRAMDSIQEKLSLADRFGITVVFSSPDKKKFLQIIEGLVEQRGIQIDREQLHKEALKWELWYNGRSPRTARQFVDWLEGELR